MINGMTRMILPMFPVTPSKGAKAAILVKHGDGHRSHDLARTIHGRPKTLLTLLKIGKDVFADNDGVVHHDSEDEDKGKE